MKKMLIWLLLLLPICARGEESLYPARVDGKWGYINKTGEMVIAPQWQMAELFSNGFALVKGENYQAVIDRQGNVLLETDGRIMPRSYTYCIRKNDENGDSIYAYFDPVSGYLSPFIFDAVEDIFRDDPAAPMAVLTKDPPRVTYIIPATGEKAFENEYELLHDDAEFHEGYALAANECILYDTEGNIWSWYPEFHLIDTSGRETIFPEGIFPDSPVQEGYLRISRNLTEEEWAAGKSGWGVVYGLAKPNGEIVIEPQYDYLYPPQDGCVVIMQDYRLGHIDLETGMTVEPRFEFITDSLPCYTFSNGYALLYPLQVGEQEWVQLLIDRQGREIFSTWEEDEIRLASHVFTPGGLCVYEKNHQYGLMRITEGQATLLTEAIYEKINYWNSWHAMKHPLESGWLPVKMDGLWGYVNEQAEMIIPPQWEEADIFRQDLARVEKNGKMAYINLQGDIIWQEP